MNKVQFEVELIEGHKGVTVVLVPFDPEETWSRKPVRLEGSRHGWLVVGSVNGVRFDGYIGERWNRFFIIIDKDLRDAANVVVGDTLKVSVEPTASARVLERARHQSKVTTAPKKPVRMRSISQDNANLSAAVGAVYDRPRSLGCEIVGGHRPPLQPPVKRFLDSEIYGRAKT